MSSFLFTFNVVSPIFILIFFGWFLKRIKMINEEFTNIAEKIAYNIALPALLLLEIAQSDTSVVFDVKFILFSVIGTLLQVLFLFVFVQIGIRTNDTRGAFIQAAFRSSFAIIGIPLIQDMIGGNGMDALTSVLPYTVIMFNFFAVLAFSVYAPKDEKQSALQTIKKCTLNVIKSPQIIASVIGIIILLSGITLPIPISKSLTYISDILSPLALLCIGANLSTQGFGRNIKLSVLCTAFKILIFPTVAFIIAYYMGFRGAQLAVLFVQFGGPASATGYIMAKSMKSDHHLTSNVILLSTVFSMFTIFAGVFIMNHFNLI